MKKKQESIDIENGVEANLLEAILNEENIPHYIRTWNDLAYDGIYQLQKGWGIVETPGEYRDRVRVLLDELRKTRGSADPADTNPAVNSPADEYSAGADSVGADSDPR